MSSGGGSSFNSQAMGFASQLGFQLPFNQKDEKKLYKELITSKILLSRILDKKFFTEKFGTEKRLLDLLLNDRNNIENATQKALHLLQRSIFIKEDLRSQIFTLQVNAFEPMLAYEINKVIVNELELYQKDINKIKTKEARIFIEKRINDTKQELDEAEQNLRKFLEGNRRIENSPNLQLENERLDREIQVLTSVYTTLKQNLETTKIEEVKDSDFVIFIDNPNIPFARTSPKRKVLLILSTIFGFIFSCVMITLNDYLKYLKMGFINDLKKNVIKSFKNK
tara:strand:+ start:848 stop:1690 length:843 start_codon:yes stop_codon:yes gene_type:complete